MQGVVSWGRYAQSRDKNEKPIIAALLAAGCAVQQLNGAGVPDLLVSLNGVMTLLEVKNPEATGGADVGGKRTKGQGRMKPAQVKWWAAWQAAGGKPPVVVTTPGEALEAVGARSQQHQSAPGGAT